MFSSTTFLLFLTYFTLILSQAATRYNWPGDGDSCRKQGYVNWSVDYDGGFCGAISEGLFREIGVSGTCGSSTCQPNGSGCNDCCDEGKISPPQCPYNSLCTPESGQAAKYFCVKCNEPTVCKHSDWVRIGVSEACPSAHPCNSCKGVNNPCADGKKTVDLCENAFWNLFSDQVGDDVNGGGNKIEINANWKQFCPNSGRNSGSAGCTDNPPDSLYTCAQQAGWGKCAESFMASFCQRSCGRCKSDSSEDDDSDFEIEDLSSTPSDSEEDSSDFPPFAIGLIVVGSMALIVVIALIVKTIRHRKRLEIV